MKRFPLLIAVLLILAAFLPVNTQAQDDTPVPTIVAVTTLHWNMEKEDGSNEEWQAMAEELHQKTVVPNEYILQANFLIHLFTEDNTEAKSIRTYASLSDMEKANERTAELVEEAWPDKEERKAFFEKFNSYYSDMHSDEIYRVIPGAKPLMEMSEEPMVHYVQIMQRAAPVDEEFAKMHEQYAKAVHHKNPHVKAYYTMTHFWGGDARDLLDVFVLESMNDVTAALDAISGLQEEAWPDEEERKAMGKKWSEYFTGVHGDYFYSTVPGLMK